MLCPRWARPLIAWSLFLPATSLAQAEAFSASLTTAREQYDRGEFNAATRALRSALTQVQEAQLGLVKEAFPQPLPDWRSGAAEGELVAATVFRDSGITARRSYEASGQQVEILLITGSPLVHSKQLAMENPVLLTWSGSPEIEVTKIQGQKAVKKWMPQQKMGEINIVVDDALLILLAGTSIESMEPLEQYAAGIDYKILKAYLGR